MQFLALLIAVSLTGDVPAEAIALQFPDSGPPVVDLCDFGRRMADLEACTDPKSCEALRWWKNLYGPPAPGFARPDDSPRLPKGWTTTADTELRERSFSYWGRQIPYRERRQVQHCWAADDGSGRLARP